MFNLFDYLARVGERQSVTEVARLIRLYPHLFEGAEVEYTPVASARPISNQKKLQTLESSHSHTA